MTSSFASLFTTFLVATLLLPNIKVMIVSSVSDAKQEHHSPHSRAVPTADERTSRLLSRRRALATAATAATCTPDYTHQSAFHLEITTDHNPTEMLWTLSDAKTNQVIHSVEGDDKYNRPNSFYQQSFFLESKGFCYHFQMIIKKDDAICCAWDNGFYHAFYDDKLVMEGSNFGKSEASLLFGDACKSSISQTSDPSSSSSETGVLSGPPPLTSSKQTLSLVSNKDLPFTSSQPAFLPFVSSPSSKPSITSVLTSTAPSSTSKLPSSSLSLEPSDKPKYDLSFFLLFSILLHYFEYIILLVFPHFLRIMQRVYYF
jgi:hypothetical protein